MQDGGLTLERGCTAPVDRVWRMLIRPALWWGETVVLEPLAGGRFVEPWQDAAGQHVTRGRVKTFAPPERLELSWRDDDWLFETQVVIQLSRSGEGSRIGLLHQGWDAAPEDRREKLIAAHRRGWAHHLGNLAACAEAHS